MTTLTKEQRQEVAQIIIQQLGGIGKLSAMVGAHSFMIEDCGLSFQFKGFRKAKKVIIDLLPTDLYRMRIGKTNMKNLEWNEVYNQDGLYWDMLKPEFERVTGLYLSL